MTGLTRGVMMTGLTRGAMTGLTRGAMMIAWAD